MTYDSTADTLEHIGKVQANLDQVVAELAARAERHDLSKLSPPEKTVFDEYTPKLEATTYGSDEYREHLQGMGAALAHHYAVNDHHPEHHPNGTHDMDLLQVIEMLCDWRAATERHADGDLRRSIEDNASRFDYGYPLERMLTLTAERLGWL